MSEISHLPEGEGGGGGGSGYGNPNLNGTFRKK